MAETAMFRREPMSNDQAVDVEKFLNKVRKQREAANATVEQIEFELVRFDGENAPVDLNVDWSAN
jgi:hypothetical protein